MVGRGQRTMSHEAAVLGPWELTGGGRGGAATEAYVGRVAYSRPHLRASLGNQLHSAGSENRG